MKVFDSPTEPPPQSRLRLSPWIVDVFLRGLIPLLGVVCLTAGLLGIVNHAVLPMTEALRTRNWVPAVAVVETATVRPAALGLEPSSLDMLVVRYRYSFGGKSYVGQSYGPHHGLDRAPVHEEALRALGAATAVTVWVNPAAPEQAVLSRKLRWPVMALALPALAMCLVGGLLVFAGMVAWNNWRSWRYPVR